MNTTVLIANHNYGRYLKRAIESAIHQTVQPSIICIIDDGSTDSSWDIIRGYAEPNQREERVEKSGAGDILIKVGDWGDINIVAIKIPTATGPSEARNLGIYMTMHATDVYAILDADDEFLPNKLEECLKPFKNESVGVVYANYNHVNSNTGIKTVEIKEPFDIFRLQQECIVHSGALIRAAVLDKVKDENGYYDRNMRTCEDWDLWVRASKVCAFYHIPLVLTNVLVHPHNSTNSVPKEVWQANWQRIAQKHK